MTSSAPPVPPFTATEVADYVDGADLDMTMKTRMVDWLFAVSNWAAQTPDAPSGWRNLGNTSGLGGDAFLNSLNRLNPSALKAFYLNRLADYNAGKLRQTNPGGIGVGEHVPKIPNPLHTMNDLIGAVTNPNLWIRVAEFSVGAILIAVGLNAVLRPGKPLPSINPIRKVLL